MRVNNLIANNINGIKTQIDTNCSISICGLSGSGKTTFCQVLAEESLKRVVTLLPKSEYRFLFPDLKTNFSAQSVTEMPLIFFLEKSSFSSNPRSTVGTHTGIFKAVRDCYARESSLAAELFSFNNSFFWCTKCKGRGSTSGAECKECQGSRYSPEIKKYTVGYHENKYDITQINQKNAFELKELADTLGLSDQQKKIIDNMINLNIGYLTLDRVVSTLSGGETVRLLLAEFMTYSKNCLIVIDEISIGLDASTLERILLEIRKLGKENQIWLIDHSDKVIASTEKSIFFGPKSGKYGGKIVSQSPRVEPINCLQNISQPVDYYLFTELHKRNIQITELSIPRNRLTTITGESGCGKSTLANECIVHRFDKLYKNDKLILIGQDKIQSITSKSTIETFLDLKKKLSKVLSDYNNMSIQDVIELLPKDTIMKQRLNMLVELGLGYLTLTRKIQTLSTGEFQCVHLVSELFNDITQKTLFIFDEPSKGLSQNILNRFLSTIRNILEDPNITIMMIEHSPYLIHNSDYIIDFGKRKNSPVTNLKVQSYELWHKSIYIDNKESKFTIKSVIPVTSGIEFQNQNVEEYFLAAEKRFKGGILKNISQTARWIYSDYNSDEICPEVVIDLEKQLYSKHTFLYEIAGLINYIIALNPDNKDTEIFDYYSRENQCACCKGTGQIKIFDFDIVAKNVNKSFWDGLLLDEVMTALKKYNYSKIKFLFKEIKKEAGYDLSKPYSAMTDDERCVFLYGYWQNSFYDASKKATRVWKGIVFLIVKYMRSSQTELKAVINESKANIICPVCHGHILNHSHKLSVKGKDVREIVSQTIQENYEILSEINLVNKLLQIINSNMRLNQDISLLSLETQARLKLLEIESCSFYGYHIVLKNVSPFAKEVMPYIENIAVHNQVTICDYPNINETKQAILENYFTKGKIKAISYVYEIFGFKKVMTEINKLRNRYPCKYCDGKKVLREESIFDEIDVTESPCMNCNETGISDIGLKQIVEGYSAKTWLTGAISDIVGGSQFPENLAAIKVAAKLQELNKKELTDIYKFIRN